LEPPLPPHFSDRKTTFLLFFSFYGVHFSAALPLRCIFGFFSRLHSLRMVALFPLALQPCFPGMIMPDSSLLLLKMASPIFVQLLLPFVPRVGLFLRFVIPFPLYCSIFHLSFPFGMRTLFYLLSLRGISSLLLLFFKDSSSYFFDSNTARCVVSLYTCPIFHVCVALLFYRGRLSRVKRGRFSHLLSLVFLIFK